MNTNDIHQTIPIKEKKSEIAQVLPPIVGIGASAGGLDALELFFKNVPENSGLAYVVIQHLDPTRKGMLPELLQRFSVMKVYQVKDLMQAKPDNIYVIPPNKSMSILKGVFHLFEPVETRGLRLPIDFFLQSLADDQKGNAVGIILSGMGSDGSNGIRAIKEKNGVVLVQEPETAQFDSMPRNAINSGPIDIIAPPEKLPSELVALLKQISSVKTKQDVTGKDNNILAKILILIRTSTGNDFSLYKENTVYRRIERRMVIHKLESMNSYVQFLQENPKEVHILFKELLIGVTNFFRDPQVWKMLREKIFPTLIKKTEPQGRIRAWVSGCSTGEEAYSLAIIFKETLEKIYPNSGITLQIFASDIDSDAIEYARKGLFSHNIASDVSQKRLNRFFIKTEEGYGIKAEIREMVIFAQHNIIMQPPFSNLDIVTCRNLLIYLDPELQRKLLSLFYYSLNKDGILVLGTSESLGVQNHLFTTVDSKCKIFIRSKVNLHPQHFDFPTSISQTKLEKSYKKPAKPIVNIQTQVDQLLLQQFSPAGVLVNETGDIVYISGRTGKYLEPAVGKANLNIFAMLRDGFQNDFSIAFRKAVLNKETVTLHNMKIRTHEGSFKINVKIQWIHKPEPLYGKLMIIFSDVPKSDINKQEEQKEKSTVGSNREAELEEELEHSRDEMQHILEQIQSSQEELKLANEELQSTNEELQSTNEELTTSKEEMQSLNEELQTVNAELMAKVDDYSQVNNDMKNLLNSTDIATLFLDKKLNIRGYTNQATKIFKIIKTDVGRPFTDQASLLIYPELPEDAKEVLETLMIIEKQIPTDNDQWFSIRIMPYRTSDDRIDGLVITFIDITELKQVDESLRIMKKENHLLSKLSSLIIIKISAGWKILAFNSAAEIFFGKSSDDVIGKNYLEIFIPEALRHQTRQQLSKLFKSGSHNIKLNVISSGTKEIETEWNVKVLTDGSYEPKELIMISEANQLR